MSPRKALLTGISSLGLLCLNIAPALAEDCTGTLPTGDCTLDENTTAALTIDAGVTLTVGGSVTIGHTINGDDSSGDGAITTNSGGVAVNQTAAIGSTTAIDSLTIGDGDSWTTSANIITNNNGTDIDLGAADGGEILTFNNGADFIGEIDGNAADILNFGADGNGGTFTAGGQIESVTVNVTSGTLLVSSTAGSGTPLSDVTVSQGATMRLNQSLTSSGAFSNDGSVYIVADETLTAGTYTADANAGTFTLELNRDEGVTEFGGISITAGGPVDFSNDIVQIAIAQGTEVIDSQTIANVITGNGGATLLPTVSENSFLYDYSLVQNGNNVDLVVSRRDLATVGTSTNNTRMTSVLLSDLAAAGDITIGQIQNALVNASSQEDFNEIVESTLPDVDAGVSAASSFVTNKTITLAQQRLAYLRNGNHNSSGISSGNGTTVEERDGGRLWGQVFVTSGQQDSRGSVDGYDLNALGMSVGADTGRLHDNLVMGMALTYAETNIESDNANATETDVDSYQVALYGTYEVEHDTFWNGTVAYGYNNVSAERLNVGQTGKTATAKYDSEQLTMYTEFGHDFEFGKTIITPVLLTYYSYLETENYREKGADGANLTVNTHSLQAWDLGGRVDFAWEKIYDSGQYLRPAVSVGYKYDVLGDPLETIAVLEAGGPAFQINGFESQNHTISLAGGLTYGSDSWELQAHYELESRGDLLSHTGILRGTYKF